MFILKNSIILSKKDIYSILLDKDLFFLKGSSILIRVSVKVVVHKIYTTRFTEDVPINKILQNS